MSVSWSFLIMEELILIWCFIYVPRCPYAIPNMLTCTYAIPDMMLVPPLFLCSLVLSLSPWPLLVSSMQVGHAGKQPGRRLERRGGPSPDSVVAGVVLLEEEKQEVRTQPPQSLPSRASSTWTSKSTAPSSSHPTPLRLLSPPCFIRSSSHGFGLLKAA